MLPDLLSFAALLAITASLGVSASVISVCRAQPVRNRRRGHFSL